MILYVDSSFVLSIHLREPGRHEVARRLLDTAEDLACSSLGYAEVRAGLARARYRENPSRLSEAGYIRAVQEFSADWSGYFRLEVNEDVIQYAGSLAAKHLIRGYDAVHLASLLTLNEFVPGELAVATWDRALAEASVAEGLALAHEVN